MWRRRLGFAALVSLAAAAPFSSADASVWTVWGSATPSTGNQNNGSATGALGSVTVSYTGEVNSSINNPFCGGLCLNYPSWTPTSTYAGGIVTTAPAPSDGLIQLVGGDGSGLDKITFSSPVTNPIIAIWSLGAANTPAEFIFSATPTFEAGGPSAEYSGGPVSVLGDVVSGLEGNGTVAFLGTFSSISFTTPEHEDWYGFTVGEAIPEPSTWAMMGLGFAGLGFAAFRRSGKARAALA